MIPPWAHLRKRISNAFFGLFPGFYRIYPGLHTARQFLAGGRYIHHNGLSPCQGHSRLPQPQSIWLSALLLALIASHRGITQGAVYFADENLKAAVEDALWVYDPTPSDMLSLRSFSCIKQGIKDITGLEYAENLQTLWLTDNQITDISPLSGMNSMRKLVLNNNRITDTSALSDMHELKYLDLHENQLADIGPLAGLETLQVLILRINQLNDIGPLAGLVNLRTLDLSYNQIVDISALSDLTELEDLYLRGNHIQDVSALARVTALTHLYLESNNIDAIDVLAEHVNLRDLYIRNNQISDIYPLLGLTRLQTLDLRWNPFAGDDLCSYLSIIVHNNPGISCFHDGECDVAPPSDSGPSVSVAPATEITASSALLQAQIVDHGTEACTARFRYWVSGQAEVKTPWQTALRTGSAFSQSIENLQPDTPYRFVAEAKNTAGIAVSAMDGFVTLKASLVLSIVSGPGGAMLEPGEGDFILDQGTSLPITAQPTGRYGMFVAWTGTAVDAGAVANPYDANTFVQVNDNYTLQANFLEPVLHVDDDGPSDPWPHDLQKGDPQEDGTAAHPFDAIQEAIVGAPHGALILVHPGSYPEAINLMGKAIHVTGLHPYPVADLPVLIGNGTDPTVTFAQGEDALCQLSGFVLTGGRSHATLVCAESSPVVHNCLIVGNRCDRPDGAIISCVDSTPVFANLTVHGNDAGPGGTVLRLVNSRAVVTNSILWENVPSSIQVDSGDTPLITYCNVQGAWPGTGNIQADPCFARAGTWTSDSPSTWRPGDYHLSSSGGRWDPDSHTWLTDTLSSPCIDTGAPDEPHGQEPAPHGKRINMGVYGGTVQASLSSVPILAHWRFDETAGETAVDSAGDSNGKIHGATWTSGKVGGALFFDGIDDWVDCGNRPALVSDQCSLALWIYPQANFASRTVLRKGGPDAEDFRFELFGAQYPTFSFGNGADSLVLYSSAGLPRDEWTHVTLTRDLEQACLYVNGIPILNRAYGFAPPATDHPLTVGGSDNDHYQGKIDDLRIYGQALSEEDISALASEAR